LDCDINKPLYDEITQAGANILFFNGKKEKNLKKITIVYLSPIQKRLLPQPI
jgi:hypothetical protein